MLLRRLIFCSLFYYATTATQNYQENINEPNQQLLKMSNHTPGPWKVDGTYIYEVEQDKIIAEVETYNDNELPYEANARLMAAAPKMKQKLDEMTELLRIIWACVPEEIAGTCTRQIADWEVLKAKIEGDE